MGVQSKKEVTMDSGHKVEAVGEQFAPEVFAVIFGLLTYFILHRGWYVITPETKITEVFGSVVNICAIAVGFLGTVAAVLISLDSSKAIEVIRAMGLYKKLFGYIMKAVVWSFLCAVITTILILYQDLKDPSYLHFFILSAWTALASASCFSSLLVVFIFSLILRKVANEDEAVQP